MKKFLSIVSILFLAFIVIYLSCIKDTSFNPTGEIGVTIEAFVCDTAGLDTTITISDSLTGTVTALSVYAGQTISFLGFVKGDSVNDITWSWNFWDTITSLSRIVEHRYMTPGEYKAVFTVTNSVGVSLSDTVNIFITQVPQHAAVRGYAFLQGKSKHDGIEVCLHPDFGADIKINTIENGLFQMLSNVFYGLYTIYYTDKKTGWFSPDTIKDVIITDGILNELGKVTLKDKYYPHIKNCYPTGTVEIREPVIQGVLIDTASGIAKETFLLLFNGDTIPDSLITCNDSDFSWQPSLRLPDGNCSVFASIKDSAGNSVSKTWGFTVDAMKLIAYGDTTVSIYDSVNLYGKVENVYSQMKMYKWDYDGNGLWDDSITTSDTIVMVKHSYPKDSLYKAVLYARDDSGMVKYDTVDIIVKKYMPIAFAGEDTTVSINDTIRLHGSAIDSLRTITSWAWDIGNTGSFINTSTFDTTVIAPASEDSNYQCVLRVTDDDGNIAFDTVVITVLQDAPTADAGNDTTVGFGCTINLHGTASQQFGTIIKWEWKIDNDPWKEISGSDTSFIAPRVPKTYLCSLRVTDDDGLCDTDHINIEINAVFTPYTITSSADGATSVFALDIDGDTDIDVLSASANDDKIAWYENDGSENFTAHTISTLNANEASSVFAIDMDGDGDIDVLSASSGDDKIAWYENDGSENFTLHTITTSADNAQSVFAIDLDGDKDIDVLSASGLDPKIAWYENDGAENFSSHTITAGADIAQSVFAIDLDGDGDIDILSASPSDSKILWHENVGSGVFTAHTITTSADWAQSVFAIDIDGDGDIDVLSASSGDDKIAWYENDGNDNFTAHTITTLADHAVSVFAIDINGDGDIDVLSASANDDKIAWYENDGNESFTAHTITTAIDGAWSVFAIDVDGDNDIDVLSASNQDSKIEWYENGD